MKPIITVFLLLFICNVFGQTIDEIKSSGGYYWGEGKAKTLVQADKNALNDLISQISVSVKYSMVYNVSEANETYNQYAESNTQTYSNATLQRAERKVIEGENETTVIRYITKSDMQEVFNDRKVKIQDYIKLAAYAEKELRIGDALKYYYWSLALLRSIPDCDKIRGRINDDDSMLLMTAIPDKINSVLNSVDFTVEDVYKRDNVTEALIKVSYKGKPVDNFDFSYWTGDTWSVINSTKNGIGLVQISGDFTKYIESLRIRSEYIYANNSRIDPDVNSVIENTVTPFFKSAEYKITDERLRSDSLPNIENKEEAIELNTDYSEYQASLEEVKKAISLKNTEIAKTVFTTEGFEMFKKLMSYGSVLLLPENNEISFITVNGVTYARAVPMSFNFKRNNRNFIEDVVFIFDEQKKICALSFSLGNNSIQDILNKSDAFASPENKLELVNFLESYKTAYCLGRLDYLEKIFSDNALIIVGTVLKNDKPIESMYSSLGTERVEYIKLSKTEYLQRLKYVFSSNEYVNIQFDDNTVKKADENIYGIQIAQNYYSANYADKGYLFLMIDLNDSVNPKIYVRTWQPEKNPDGSVIGITDFKF